MEARVEASIHKHTKTTLDRVKNYISCDQFKDVNLLSKLYPSTKKFDWLYHWEVPGEPGSWQKWSFNQVIRQEFKPVTEGQAFGPLWSTHWFRIEVEVPDEFVGKEVWLRWDSGCEAMLWSADGEPLQGLSPGNDDGSPRSPVDETRTAYSISWSWEYSQKPLIYYVEMACNTMFGGGKDGLISPPDDKRQFTIKTAEIFVLDPRVYKLILDLEVLHDMAKFLPKEDPRGFEALYTANHMVNCIIKNDQGTASKVADDFLSKRPGSRTHTIALIGNCHIDSAWLWPYSETIRKCARSWLSTLRLMEEYPEMKFACSQAQQFAWVKEHYPDIYIKICINVEAGRFLPVGGTWVEMDGLIPSGESFMRQFLYGQLFFKKEFKMLCHEFWLPDTFGYSAQLPQICKHFGIKRFLTQKLSWNLVNKFPHHTFIWEGLDGSSLIAHFPPGDSYEMKIKVEEVMRTVRNQQDKGRVSTSALLYGYGDGGGGPTREMLERARRLANVDGCPRLKHMTPGEFFCHVEEERHNLCRWTGELFLELHNGTYTSQANTKRQNRVCEFALRDAEMFLAIAAVKGKLAKDKCYKLQEDLQGAWQCVLLNQFHDVVPGSSIGMVYRDSDALYHKAHNTATRVATTCLSLILGDNSDELGKVNAVVNTLPWEVNEVLIIDSEVEVEEEPSMKRAKREAVTQSSRDGACYLAVKAEGCGWCRLIPSAPPPVTLVKHNNNYIIENQFIRGEVDQCGRVVSLTLADSSARDVFQYPDGSGQYLGNQLVLYDDVPLFWDAWDTMDYHLETATPLNNEGCKYMMKELKVLECGPLMVRLQWKLKISDASFLSQEIELSALSQYLTFNTHVQWHENRKFLKVAFDTAIHARTAAFDTQFGFIERPTHTNTSWETAKFEVCGHKWADISEYDFGMAVLNDGKYGWSARGRRLSLSLLRSPKAPDPHCDMGSHTFRYALMPHRGSLQSAGVQQRAYEFNSQLKIHSTVFSSVPENWMSVVGKGVMIAAVKLAEDHSRDVVVRLYEQHGATSSISLKILPTPRVRDAFLCSGLETAEEEVYVEIDEGDQYQYITLKMLPFKIVSVRISFEFYLPQ